MPKYATKSNSFRLAEVTERHFSTIPLSSLSGPVAGGSWGLLGTGPIRPIVTSFSHFPRRGAIAIKVEVPLKTVFGIDLGDTDY